jgi:hypothetical protein
MRLAGLLTAAATFLEADGAAHDIIKAASLYKLRPAKGCDTASRHDIAALLRAEAVKQRMEPGVTVGRVTVEVSAFPILVPSRPHLRPDGIPSRCDLLLHTPAELAIRKAVDEVEKLGADPKLTEAANLLDMARERVADFVEALASRG